VYGFTVDVLGWSYGLNGKLTKAPRYQELDGFDKEKNGLFPTHVHIDKLGFIWVNLDAAETPSVRWEDDFAGVDEQPGLKPFVFSQYRFDHAWDMMGDYNWKTLADNYNEVGCSTISAKRWLMISAITVRLAIPGLCNIPILESTGWKPRLGISSITTQIDQIMRHGNNQHLLLSECLHDGVTTLLLSDAVCPHHGIATAHAV
jgi:hypothetical protein